MNRSKTRQKRKSAAPKSVVERAIVRIVTPGTLSEDDLLDARSANRIAALARLASGELALAHADISEGRFASLKLDEDDSRRGACRAEPGRTAGAR